MKQLLLIADLDSVHTYNYCRNLLSSTDFDITLLNLKGGKETVKSEYLQYYERQNYKLHFCKQLKDGHYKYMISFFRVLKDLGKFDYLHLHYVSHYLTLPIFLLSSRYRHIILTYWGSDLFRSNTAKRLMTLPLLVVSNKITFITFEMQERFRNLSFPYRMSLKKSQVIDYGNLFFESIRKAQSNGLNKIKAKELLGFPTAKKIISIGYCWRKEMQQLKTLEAIFEGGFLHRDKVFFVIPAVGIDANNKKNIIDCLERNNANYYIQTSFWNLEQITAFRIATDIFIHAQTTDSLSSAMMEHLYAGGIVMNGRWLKYDVLDKHEVKYLQFDSISDIPVMLDKVLEKIDAILSDYSGNQNIIDEFASWDYWRPQWQALYI